MTRRTMLVVALGVLGLLVVAALVLGLTRWGENQQPVAVLDVRGLRLDIADERLERVGINVDTTGGGSLGVVIRSNWWVCSQDPPPGRSTTDVLLAVDRECKWTVPGVTGLPLVRAHGALDKAGVPYDDIDVNGRQPLASRRWIVCDQNPPSGITTSRVRLTVARVCELPDVTGMMLAEAVRSLEKRGLAVKSETEAGARPATGGRWRVCSQSPAPLDAANAVTLSVAQYCRTAVPDVEWSRLDVARERLDTAGLEYQVVTPKGTPPLPNMTVCDQDPEPGVEAVSVTLFVIDAPSQCAETWPRSR